MLIVRKMDSVSWVSQIVTQVQNENEFGKTIEGICFIQVLCVGEGVWFTITNNGGLDVVRWTSHTFQRDSSLFLWVCTLVFCLCTPALPICFILALFGNCWKAQWTELHMFYLFNIPPRVDENQWWMDHKIGSACQNMSERACSCVILIQYQTITSEKHNISINVQDARKDTI